MDISEHTYYRDFVWAVELNRFGLELVGLWPKMNEVVKNSYSSDLRVAIIFVALVFSGIPLVYSLIRVRTDMILVIDNLQTTLPLMVVSLKLFMMRWKRTAVLTIIKMMAEDWMALKIHAERDVMIKRARTARLIVICGYVLMILAFTTCIVFPCFGVPFRHVTNLTDRNKPLPLQSYYFYDTDKSPQFELTLVTQAITIFLSAITYTSVDAFLGLTILHICGQLENFRYRLANLVSYKDFDSALRNNVTVHLRLIRFADKIEDTFGLMMLGLVIYFGIVFCLYGFLLLTIISDSTMNDTSFSRVIYIMCGVTTLLVHTFLYCRAGELIAEQCEAIYRTIHGLEWYKLESRKARNLILLMTRAGEPFRITAGKIIPLTMTTFCSLLKTSAGYISFLLAKRDFVWAIELNRLGLELIGLWPKTNEAIKDTFVSDIRVGMVFFVVTFLSIIPLLCSFVRVWGDMILIVDNLQVTLPLIVVSLKLVIIRWKRTAVALLVQMMAEDWMESKIDTERNVMIRQARAARLIVISGYFLMIFVFIILIVLPSFGLHFRYITNLTDRRKLLPFQAYYFYDTDKSPQYEIAFVIQATTMFVGAITYTSVDAFLGLTILHVCGQLENFKHRLNNLVSCKDFDSALRNNVETHLRIIRFASNIEDIFTLMMLGLVFYFGIVFCLFGFLLVTVINGDEIGHISLSRVCFLVIGIFTLLAHTLLYCGAGEIMAKQCEAVYSAMCNLEWYKLESGKEKNLILLMIRANEPFRITAGKIFPLTMATFCSLLKTSAGYVSFLLAKR